MAQVSKYPLREDIYQRIISIFLKTLINIREEKEALQFITDFLSPTEKIMLAKRLAIALLLKKGCNYGQIKDILRVSQGTISGVNAFLRYSGKGYHQILDKIISDEKMDEFWDKVEKTILNSLPDKGKGAAFWRYLKEEVQKKKPKVF